jgi:hypothetical protein
MFLLCFVISESALASSCKVDLGASVESYESENCIEKENYWIVQSCSTKLFCKVTNKDLVKTHKYKCPKSTGNPKLSCFTFPKTKFNSSAFKIISVDDIKELSKIEKHSSGFVFYEASSESSSKNIQAKVNSEPITGNELRAFGSKDMETVKVCASNTENFNTIFLISQSDDTYEECKF